MDLAFSAKLKSAMQATIDSDGKPMSGYRLAPLSGFSEGHVNKVVNGVKPPTPNFAERVAPHLVGGEWFLAWARQARLGEEGLAQVRAEVAAELGVTGGIRPHSTSGSATRASGPAPRAKHSAKPSDVLFSGMRGVDEEMSRMALCGEMPCGNARDLEDIGETVEVPTRLAIRGDIAAIAVGDSLDRRGVMPGDILVIRRQSTAEVGQLVAVWLEGEGRMCKRLRSLPSGRLVLAPESSNQDHLTYPLDDRVTILGIVRGIHRLDREED